jgi:hypothetical protein
MYTSDTTWGGSFSVDSSTDSIVMRISNNQRWVLALFSRFCARKSIRAKKKEETSESTKRKRKKHKFDDKGMNQDLKK